MRNNEEILSIEYFASNDKHCSNRILNIHFYQVENKLIFFSLLHYSDIFIVKKSIIISNICLFKYLCHILDNPFFSKFSSFLTDRLSAKEIWITDRQVFSQKNYRFQLRIRVHGAVDAEGSGRSRRTCRQKTLDSDGWE